MDWFREVIEHRVEVKFKASLERKRPGAVRILNRIATVTSGGLAYEADLRHAEILMKDVGIDGGSEGVTTPGSNSKGVARGDRSEVRQRREQAQSGRGERKLPGTK